MITNLNKKKQKKNDSKVIGGIIFIFLFLVWICTPPGNKFMQLCFLGNNTKFMIAKITNKDETTAHKFYRNNAIYLVKMDMQKQALKEIDKAINAYPAYMSEAGLEKLYKDRAQIKIFCHDYKGALSDYLKVTNLDFTDKFKLAMLFKVNGKNKHAMQTCNNIITFDPSAYSGYLCVAEVYAGIGRYESSVNTLNLLIDKFPRRGKYYADRANYKKLAGDIAGYEADIAKAKELTPRVDLESSLVEDTLNPKKLNLPIN